MILKEVRRSIGVADLVFVNGGAALNRFPVLGRLIVSHYRLYPGTAESAGIDFRFQDGISLLAGINGLGKTTLINLIFRLLVGPFDLPKDAGSGRFGSAAKANVIPWSGRTTFFPQRVADKAQHATAELMFSVGDWPAAGFVDTEIRCFMKPEVAYAAKTIWA